MVNKQIAWDYVVYATIWEAEYAVQYPVLVPSVFGTEHIKKITVIGKKLVNIEYANGINYRTSNEKEDISGVYNNYPEKKELNVSVEDKCYRGTAKGANGRIFLAIWNDDTYSYSLTIPHGVSIESLKDLIKSLKQVNSDGSAFQSSAVNPMVEYNYLFEAEYAVGFGIAVPAVLEAGKLEKIFVIDGKVVELNYKNDIVYRTAKGTGDISGSFEHYPHVEAFTEGPFEVTAKGNADLYYVSLWTGCGMTWSLSCPHGIHKKSLIKLINSLALVDSSCDKAAEGFQGNAMAGSYGSYHLVTEEEKEIFKSAVNLVGVDYEPLAVATQLVAGRNYRFVCNAKVVYSQDISHLALVTIFQPFAAEGPNTPVVTDIKRLD